MESLTIDSSRHNRMQNIPSLRIILIAQDILLAFVTLTMYYETYMLLVI